MKRTAVIIALALIATAAMGYELRLSDEERAQCAAGGGCRVVTEGWLTSTIRQAMQEAYAAGAAAGASDARSTCKGST